MAREGSPGPRLKLFPWRCRSSKSQIAESVWLFSVGCPPRHRLGLSLCARNLEQKVFQSEYWVFVFYSFGLAWRNLGTKTPGRTILLHIWILKNFARALTDFHCSQMLRGEVPYLEAVLYFRGFGGAHFIAIIIMKRTIWFGPGRETCLTSESKTVFNHSQRG